MTECYQKARELGELILTSEESIRFADALAVYNQSTSAQKKMNDYKAFQAEMQEGVRTRELSKAEFTERAAELSNMAAALKKDPIVGALIFAENEFNGFVNGIINILKMTITGDATPENGCGGYCDGGGCSGCEGHEHSHEHGHSHGM